MEEPVHLKKAGARWYHTADGCSPSLTKASLGAFFASVLSAGAHVGSIWPINHRHHRSAVVVTVFMTPEMKSKMEAETTFKFKDPPKVKLA